MEVRERVEKSRGTVFVPMFCGSGVSKVRFAKAAGAEPFGRLRYQNCTRLWHVRSTSGSWGLEKVHAAVARSTLRNHNFSYTGNWPQTVCGGRKLMYQIQAAVAVEQKQIRWLDIIVAAAAGTCSAQEAMSTQQDFLPEPHTTTFKRISKERQRRTFYIEVFRRSSRKNFLWASQKNSRTSTTAEHCQDLNARIFWGLFQEDLHKIFSQGPVRDPAKAAGSMSLRSPQDLLEDFTRISTRSSHKEWYKTLTKILMIG